MAIVNSIMKRNSMFVIFYIYVHPFFQQDKYTLQISIERCFMKSSRPFFVSRVYSRSLVYKITQTLEVVIVGCLLYEKDNDKTTFCTAATSSASAAFTSAPAFTNSFRTSSLPLKAALCSGVALSMSR
jgi:hypothetical protein